MYIYIRVCVFMSFSCRKWWSTMMSLTKAMFWWHRVQGEVTINCRLYSISSFWWCFAKNLMAKIGTKCFVLLIGTNRHGNFRVHVELQGSKKKVSILGQSLEEKSWNGDGSSLMGLFVGMNIYSHLILHPFLHFWWFCCENRVFKEGLTMVWAIAKPANFEELRSSSFVFLALSLLVAPSSWRIWVRTATTMILGKFLASMCTPKIWVVITVTTQTTLVFIPCTV